MKFVLVTGMSGAGKSVALKLLEDSGFEAIDNLPLTFLPSVVAGAGEHNVAIGVDIRSRDFSVKHFRDALAPLRSNQAIEVSLLFLDSDDEVLRRRFTETRRRHPLALDRAVIDGIRQERRLIYPLRDIADLVIDTSEYEAPELRKVLMAHFSRDRRHLALSMVSFSFRRGVPREADIVFDVRFLKNPHYDPALRDLTGRDAAVGEAIESDRDFAAFWQNFIGLLLPLLPRYLEEGRSYLTVAVGCTGGRHRSVYMAEKLGGFLTQSGYNVSVRHRDLEKRA
ncbi:MAG: RNase adapter RapZ [Pseudomonadota bacterium]|nr:RNase adapter RapZ [Pseudomonadota bacterium]